MADALKHSASFMFSSTPSLLISDVSLIMDKLEEVEKEALRIPPL
jgi:hypothetical protein